LKPTPNKKFKMSILHPSHYAPCFFFLSLLMIQSLNGQVYYLKSDSTYFNTNFYKQLSSWNWQGNLNIHSAYFNSWKFHINEQFRSNMIVLAQGQEQWKDENTARGLLYYNKPVLDFGFYMKSWYQNDEQSSTDNEFGNQILGIFSTYKPARNLKLTPYSGIQHSKNRTYLDWGWNVGFRGQVEGYKMGDYNLSTYVDSDFDIYDERQNFDNEFHIGAETKFNQYTGDSISFSFNDKKKEYYGNDPREKTIIEVNVSERNLKNRLYYNLSNNNRFLLLSSIESRKYDFVTNRNIFYIDNDLRFYHYGSNLYYQISLRTNDETQDNTAADISQISTDNRTRQTMMKLQGGYRISNTKNFEIELAYSKLQYDTPDINNTEDRDEQRYIFEAGYNHRFSEYLDMEWTLYAYFYHKIYLSAEQSQNNNWNRVYKLSPKVNYNYGRISNQLNTEVLANYSIYDFEEFFTRTRSFIFRKYTLSDSLIYRFYKRLNLGIFMRLELEDKGNFFQNDGTQQLVQSYRSDFFNLFFENEDIFNFSLRLGYTFYSRIEWRHIPEKSRNRTIDNDGPYLSARYNLSRRLVFFMYASISHLDDSSVGSSSYSTGSLNLNYLF